MKKMNKKGFTLVEMLVVIAIIAILVSILIPTVLGATDKAKAATDAANLRSALAEFQVQYLLGETPDGWEGVGAEDAEGKYQYYTKAGECKSDKDLTVIIVDAKGSNAAFVEEGTKTFPATNDIKYFSEAAEGKKANNS